MSLTLIASIVGAVLAAIGAAYFKGSRAGRDAAKSQQLEKDVHVQREFDEIDRAAPDLDSSLGRLRQRAEPNGKAPPR